MNSKGLRLRLLRYPAGQVPQGLVEYVQRVMESSSVSAEHEVLRFVFRKSG